MIDVIQNNLFQVIVYFPDIRFGKSTNSAVGMSRRPRTRKERRVPSLISAFTVVLPRPMARQNSWTVRAIRFVCWLTMTRSELNSGVVTSDRFCPTFAIASLLRLLRIIRVVIGSPLTDTVRIGLGLDGNQVNEIHRVSPSLLSFFLTEADTWVNTRSIENSHVSRNLDGTPNGLGINLIEPSHFFDLHPISHSSLGGHPVES